MPDGNGNQVPIQSIDTYKEYIKNVNNEYFEKSVKARAEQDIQRLNDNIASAEAQVNELKSKMEGYEDFIEAEAIVSEISSLNKEITDLANEMPNLIIAGNQEQVTKNSSLIQQKQNEIQELQAKFDSKYKDVYEKKDEFRDSLRTLYSHELPHKFHQHTYPKHQYIFCWYLQFRIRAFYLAMIEIH